jgi:hypothetical protein
VPVWPRHEHRDHADRSQPAVGDLQGAPCRGCTCRWLPGAETIFAQQQRALRANVSACCRRSVRRCVKARRLSTQTINRWQSVQRWLWPDTRRTCGNGLYR